MRLANQGASLFTASSEIGLRRKQTNDARHCFRPKPWLRLAAITAEFQDYALAATYFERALAIRCVPAVEALLAMVRKR